MPTIPDSVAGLIDRGQVLRTRQYLRPTECLRSRNRRLAALVSSDGCFCLCLTFSDGRIDKMTKSYPEKGRAQGVYFVVMQEDGNFCLSEGSGPTDNRGLIWSTLKTPVGKDDYFAIIEEDGNFTIGRGLFEAPKPKVVWIAGTRVGIPPDQTSTPADPSRVSVGKKWNQAGGKFTPQEYQPGVGGPIGERFFFQAEDGRGVIRDSTWNVGDVSRFLSDYIQTNELGSTIPFPPEVHGANVPFYAIVPGNYAYTLRYTWDNLRGQTGTVNRQGNFTILTPRITSPGRRVGDVQVTHLGGVERLQFGNIDPDAVPPVRRPGVAFNVTVQTVANCGGQIAAIQLVRGERQFTLHNGNIITSTTNGAWVLDTRIPYGGASVDITPDAPATLVISDSPAIGMRACCTRVSVNEAFRTYIVFKPSNATEPRWMPIGRFDWNWNATIARQPDGRWAAPTVVAASTLATLVYTPDPGPLPTWTANIVDIRAATNAQFPANEPPEGPGCVTWLWRNPAARLFFGLVGGAAARAAYSLFFVGPRWMGGDSSYVVWADPKDMQSLQSIPNLGSFSEITPRDRTVQPKTAPLMALIAKATKFDVDIAPQCFFTTSDDDQAIAKQVAPLSLSEVGAALVKIASDRGLAGGSATVLDHRRVRLSFPTPPGQTNMEALAAHPQCRYLSLSSEFRFDDPTNPQM